MDAVTAAVLREVAADIKRLGGQVTEDHGHLLAALGTDGLLTLQTASELVARGAVKKITALPSGRTFFRVESLNRFRASQSQSTSLSAISQPFDVSVVSGAGPNYYNCFDHYCSCSAFHHSSIKCPTAMCKHIAALLLADATDKCVCVTIQDAELATMMCPPLPTPADA